MKNTPTKLYKMLWGGDLCLLLFTIATFLTFTSEINPPYLWHEPQKTAETQSFSPLLSNIQQGNNDFVYVSALEKILNSPLDDDSREAYAVFDKGTLTFYFDENKGNYTTTYGMKTSCDNEWYAVCDQITKVVFNESFADYRPTSCACWFYGLRNLIKIVDMEKYLKTEMVTDMTKMFQCCSSLTNLNVSNFSTANVTDMAKMFVDCTNLKTIFVGENWSTVSVTESEYMFDGCNNLYGGKGTAYNADFTDATYARVDGGTDAPGYFTDVNNPFKLVSSDLTPEGFCTWSDWVNGEITGAADCAYAIGESTGLPYGDGSVNNYIDLSAYKSLVVVTSEGAPRFLLNRDEVDGQFPDHLINIPADADQTAAYQTTKDNGDGTTTFTIDLAKIAADKGYAHLHAIKGANWDNVTVLSMKLVFEEKPVPVPAFVEGEYRITTGQELLWFANYVNSGNPGASARLMNDIVLNENLLDKVSKGETQDLITWIPIGTPENPYTGSFHTDSCSISGLYVNNPEQDYVGLFGYYKRSAQYISIKDSYFAGHDYVGGIIGYSADYNDYYEIGYSYFRGTVSGNNYVGGIVGYTEIAMKNCYVAAKAAGKSNVGAVIGGKKENDKVISHCYYDNTLTTLKAFGFTGADDAENNISGENSESFHNGEVAYIIGLYQDLSDENSYPEFTGKYVHKNLDGNGYHNPEYEDHHCKHCINYTYTLPQLVDGVYQISNADELYGFMHIVNNGNTHAHAVLTADIVVNENVLENVHTGNTEGLREWYSIGDNGWLGYHSINGSFAGIFDGNFHTISGLYFDSQLKGGSQSGFMGHFNGIVKNVIITDSYFHNSEVGGIVLSLMDIERDEKNRVVINHNTYPIIENCIFDGEIIGEGNVAGICESFSADNNGDYIKNCINYGKIIGGTYSGGILGASWGPGSVVNCYNAGELVCTDESVGYYTAFGGICGGAGLAGISNCYNTGSVSFGYGVYGYHWMQCNITNTYNNSDICKLPLTTSDTWANNITGGGNLTTAELCNGSLPEGFSDEDWIPGSTETTEDGIVYTFPHLKVFDGQYPAYSIIKDPREPYALLSDNGETVTFYYDLDKSKHEDALEFDATDASNWSDWKPEWTSAKVAILDESFKEYKPTSCRHWFSDCNNLTEIRNLDYLNTENVTDMGYMFEGCNSLTSINLSNFNTEKVTYMSGMFSGCHSLEELDLSSFNTSNVTSMFIMFDCCLNLKSLNIT